MELVPFGWDPFGFGGMVPSSFFHSTFPKVDVQETDKEVIVTADVPGMDSSKISVEAEGNLLIISGSSEQEKEKKGKKFFCKERYSKAFHRTIMLPTGVKQDGAKAITKNGTLRVTLQKIQPTSVKTKKIPIEEQ